MGGEAGLRPVSEHAPRALSGVFTTLEHDLAVDDDVFDAFAIMEGIGVGRAIDNPFGIEDGNIGELTGAQQPAIHDAEL